MLLVVKNHDYVYKIVEFDETKTFTQIYTALYDNVVMISLKLRHNINLKISNGTNKGYFTRVY